MFHNKTIIVAMALVLFAPSIHAAKNIAQESSRDLCEEFLQPLDDPFSDAQMAKARLTGQKIQPFLKDLSFKPEELDPTQVGEELSAMRKGQFDLDGSGFQYLFLIVQRYLLATKGAEGRIRPIAEVLELSEAEARRVVNFVAQIDAFTSRDQMTNLWPTFLRLSSNPAKFLKWQLSESTKRQIPHAIQSYLQRTVYAVLGGRVRYLRLTINNKGNQLTLLSPVGVYKINFYPGPVARPSIAPIEVDSTDSWGRKNDRVIHAAVDVSVDDEESKSFLRTLIRADAFLHPHLIPPTFDLYPQPAKPSDIQVEATSRLLKLDAGLQKMRAAHGPIELGLVMPTGEGKTVVAAEYAKSLMASQWSGRRPKIILVVENVQVLQQTVESFQRDLGLDPNKISMLFGDPNIIRLGSGTNEFEVQSGASATPNKDFDLVVITRSTFFQRQSSIKLWADRENKKPDSQRRPFLVIVDEAHHIGTELGQYEDILSTLQGLLRDEDRILYLSATLWHSDVNIVRDVLHGAITGPHLLEDELRTLQSGEDLETLARTQFLRATIEGYVDPIDDRSILIVDDSDTHRAIRARLRMPEMADEDLYSYLAKQIRNTRKPGIKDRYVFFEVRQERAEEGAKYLQDTLGASANSLFRTAWYMHSDLAIQDQNERMDWLRDRNTYRGSRSQHKYLTTVGQFLEGVDIRGINGIVVMRNLTSNRLSQQILGRGARLEPFKTGVRLIDVSGRIAHYLRSGGDLWDQAKYPSAQAPAWSHEPEKELWDNPEQGSTGDLYAGIISTEKIDLEPSLERERKRLTDWRMVDQEQIKMFRSQEGASQLLAFDPTTVSPVSLVNLKTWFEFWFNRFPPETQVAWKAQRVSLQFHDQLVPINQLTDAQSAEALIGFHLLAKMFNGQNARERYGLLPVDLEERELMRGMVRVMAYLDARFNFVTFFGTNWPAFDGGILRMTRPSLTQTRDLRDAFINGELLAGPKPSGFSKLFDRNDRRNAQELLNSVANMIHIRPALRTPDAESLLGIAEYYLSLETNRETANWLATYYLGLLIDHYLAVANIPSQHAWNLNGFFGVGADEIVESDYVREASEYDLWSVLDLIEYTLRNAANP